MKKLAFCSAVFVSLASGAVPRVTSVTSEQAPSRLVTVTYSIADAPGIVTPSVQTNNGTAWVDVDNACVNHLAGQINRFVEVGVHSFTWRPDKSWPDVRITNNMFRIGVKAWATNAPPDYMVVDLAQSGKDALRFYEDAAALPYGPVTNDIYKTDLLVLRKIHAANVTARIGSPESETGRGTGEAAHNITFERDYYIGVYPVTQRQYQWVMAANPSMFKNPDDYATRPFEGYSYNHLRGNASLYNWPTHGFAVNESYVLGMLRKHVDGICVFDLPTEAEWEYACRAGSGSALYNGKELTGTASSATLDDIARYRYNEGYLDNGATKPDVASVSAEHGTAKVGSYAPNAWGLYDMLGNVYEWCRDWMEVAPSVNGGPRIDNPTTSDCRILRGGAWNKDAQSVRCAARQWDKPAAGLNYDIYGFRVSCSAELGFRGGE